MSVSLSHTQTYPRGPFLVESHSVFLFPSLATIDQWCTKVAGRGVSGILSLTFTKYNAVFWSQNVEISRKLKKKVQF